MDSASQTADVMSLLREETRAQHSSLEQNLRWHEICSDKQRYIAVLARFYGFLGVWEPLAESQLRDSAKKFLQPRRKMALLNDDLRWFGWSRSHFESAPKIPSARLQLHGQSETLGSYYVLEGSTLGGQILSRELERQLGLQNGGGYSYFRSYGSAVRQAWVQFGEFLGRELASEAEVSAAVSGAKTTFEVLEQWLTSQ